MNVDKKRRTPDARDVFDDYGINAVLSQSLRAFGHRTGKKFSPMMHAMSVENAAMVCEDPEISVDAYRSTTKVGLDTHHITRYRNPSRNRRPHRALMPFRPLSHPRQKPKRTPRHTDTQSRTRRRRRVRVQREFHGAPTSRVSSHDVRTVCVAFHRLATRFATSTLCSVVTNSRHLWCTTNPP